MKDLVEALRKIAQASVSQESYGDQPGGVFDLINKLANDALFDIRKAPGIYVVDNDGNIIQVDGFSWGYEGLARPSTGQHVWAEDQGEYVVLMAGPGIEAATGRVVADLREKDGQ